MGLTDPLWIDEGLLLARLFIGICFVIHGLGKLGVVGTGNLEKFEAWLKALNVPQPWIQARMAMTSEIAGGLLLTLGLFTRPACLVLFFTMSVAAFVGHKKAGYLITNTPPGMEYPLNLAALSVMFFLTGPGRYSLDILLLS